MKTIRYNTACLSKIVLLLFLSTGCGGYGHKKEQKKIHQERVLQEKATSDLSDAVKATSESGWDSATVYLQFCNIANRHLEVNEKRLTDLKIEVSHGAKKIPLIYRSRIRKLSQRNDALRQRLATYKLTNKADWEDFIRLYQYDLQRLDGDVRKLTMRENSGGRDCLPT